MTVLEMSPLGARFFEMRGRFIDVDGDEGLAATAAKASTRRAFLCRSEHADMYKCSLARIADSPKK
ncbi:MAG: hypothetical protein A3F78_10125 [Burkholderiales bacterium RIFCSPLOWO2_12_FULL_61_40]|nr:MAG: hypothetical protein A3F78_10125 [Burkholderiales bacterium RIFCSPLOWO2_12_FULL_61_40]